MSMEYGEPPTNRVDHLMAEDDRLTEVGYLPKKAKNEQAAHYDYCDVWRFGEGGSPIKRVLYQNGNQVMRSTVMDWAPLTRERWKSMGGNCGNLWDFMDYTIC